MANYEIEKFIKRLAGRTDVEDALQRLDVLTKEENLMTAARNLEVTHRVDVKVTHVETVMDEQQRSLHPCPSVTNCHY